MTNSQNIAALSRPQWMRMLALAPEDVLSSRLRPLTTGMPYTFLRGPEAGLLMVEGKTGGTRFNLGEMLITRCTVSFAASNTVLGYAWISGDRSSHAELAALGDALMQIPEYNKLLSEGLFPELEALERRRFAREERKTAPTKVDFFTLARGEDA